ncbi:succinate dehydrogenase/fumarate reductase iron-sulfur subunit [Halorhabdus salina]|uniref:succinate dehydrogenase/fumarate reductase iron-sulfur subunit n=1 Tax=Halorhabdus salina TaxID=2750670 RepID=UPI0015EEDF24|nr:succinate dehydrogenase/fumarate reductase iron-sulfur subunit [Halorhabdus salina]
MSADTDPETDTEAEVEAETETPPPADTEPEPSVPEPGTESHQDRRMREKGEQAIAREEAAADAAAEEIETVEIRVYRYDPEVEGKTTPRFDAFHVPIEEGMTVLDALIYARDEFDSSLTFRHSCRQGVCGSDALFVNGAQRLGCQTQISDLEAPVQIEPLPHQEVVKDLVVDMQHFYEQMDAVEPYFDPDEEPEEDLEEQRQTRENREKIKLSTRCIQCGACTSSCNVAAGDNQYLGPAAINKAYRFVMDKREGEDRRKQRLETVKQEHGVWRCQTQFSCTEVCPKDIPLTEHIQELKREAIKEDIKFW